MRRKGDPFDPEAREAVRERALGLLARREHTIRELAHKLQARLEVDEGTVRAVVQELADKKLVSDERFAGTYAREAVRSRPRALRRIVSELVAKGVPALTAAEAAESAFAEAGVDDGILAGRLATDYVSRRSGGDLASRRRRLEANLRRRGFSGLVVEEVCERLLPAPEVGVDEG
ncbi:MAG TPA: regulatory protein RecX [Gemmatimonadota bacterium]|nr:regulatory protein RecX [Gemmatimonadota bacterium]